MSFILFLAAMQAAPPPVDPILIPPRGPEPEDQSLALAEAQRLLNCMQLAQQDPDAAIAEGARWALTDNGVEAHLCLGVGYENDGEWARAEQSYMQAHARAEATNDTRQIGILVNAGRMALADGNAETARSRFDTALASDQLGESERGHVLLERAQVHVVLDDGTAAQTDLIAAQALMPNDKLVWLLSATLARRQGNFDEAGDFIDRALELDQSDPAILLEAGNIAIGLNAYGVAEQAWGRASAADPDGPAGQAARRNLERLNALLSEGPTVPVELPDGVETDGAEPADPQP